MLRILSNGVDRSTREGYQPVMQVSRSQGMTDVTIEDFSSPPATNTPKANCELFARATCCGWRKA